MPDLPDQTGRTVLVTAAAGGPGTDAAVALAGAGARVLLGVPAGARGGPPGTEPVPLDLADLGSVRRAAADVRARTADRLDVLVGAADVTTAAAGTVTADGFERQIGTNHLGHAALTWLLMPALRGAPAARVVTVSSLAHRIGDLDDVHDPGDLRPRPGRHRAARAYGRSRLANLLFAAELDRRLRAHGDGVLSVAAHAGAADPALTGRRNPLLMMFSLPRRGGPAGAAPLLHAATAPGVRGGDFYGPGGPGELSGPPAPAARSAAARDEALARRLWEITAAATGVPPDPA